LYKKLTMECFKILIVDDINENLFVVSQILKDNFASCEIFQAEDVQEAVLIMQTQTPHLIITDWDMPFKSGIEFIKYLKSNNSTKDIPVIIATGVMTSSENLKDALEVGAIDYLRKPFDEIELYARVKSALRLTEYHKQSIHAKNYELSVRAMNLTQNRNLIKKITKTIIEIKEISTVDEVQSIVKEVLTTLDEYRNKNSWKGFHKSFRQTHNDFHVQLLKTHPSLTNSELKLCNLIHLGLSCKRIAETLHQTEQSVRVARSRLRSKLQIPKEQNMELYLKYL